MNKEWRHVFKFENEESSGSMNIFDLALVIKNHLNDDECQLLIEEYERKKIIAKRETSRHPFNGEMTESGYKRVEIKESSKNFDLIKSKTESALAIWLDYLQNKGMFSVVGLRGVLRHPNAFRILKYDVGNFIHPHTDWDHSHYASVTLNLNDGYSGGEFVFMNGQHKISLDKGDALVFPADHFWVHETYPILSGTRYSMNTFISSIHADDKHKVNQEIHRCLLERDSTFNL